MTLISLRLFRERCIDVRQQANYMHKAIIGLTKSDIAIQVG